MRRLLMRLAGAISGVLFVAATPAIADGPYGGSMKDGPYAHEVTSPWSGIYIGASIGYSYGMSDLRHDYDVPPASSDTYSIDQDGVFAALSVGFDHHLTTRLVWGLFGEYTFGDIRDRVTLATPGNVDLRSKLEDSWAAGGRLGVVHDGALWYLTAGYTGMNVSLADLDGVMHGYFLGAGIEKDIHKNFRMKLEYRFSDYGSETLFDGVTACCGERIEVDSSVHSVRLGLSYVFGHRDTYAGEIYR